MSSSAVSDSISLSGALNFVNDYKRGRPSRKIGMAWLD